MLSEISQLEQGIRATDQLYQTISKFHHKQLSYSPVTFTFNVATRILRATRRLVMTIICAKQYFNPTTNSKVMARKRMCMDGRTTRRLYTPPIFFGEHIG